MAEENKSSETKEEVVSFFRRALGEVVDFSQDEAKAKNTATAKAVVSDKPMVKPPEKANVVEKVLPERRVEVPAKEEPAKMEPAKQVIPERQYVSRRQRKEAEAGSMPAVRPEPRKELRTAPERPASRRKEADRTEKKDGAGSSLKKKLMAAAAVVCIAVVTACAFLGGDEPAPKVVDDTPMYIRIPGGMGAGSIAEMLEEKQIVSSRKYFLKRLRQTGKDGEVQSGTYKVHKGMKSDEVIEMIVNGRTAAIRFTIPEGYSLREMAKSLEKEGVCKGADFLKAAKEYTGLKYVGRSAAIENPMEGYLFPDTYEVPPDATAKDIVRLMADTFDERLTDDMRAAANKYGLSIHEFVTLASLVEKEVMDDDDRPKVAQVFLKRLEIEMPIQSCATIQYLLKEPKEDLTFDDLKIESPYNTYEHPGLPPGPIASPGEKALEAAANPSATKYLYFVADRKGKTYYSETFDEHMEKVEKYR